MSCTMLLKIKSYICACLTIYDYDDDDDQHTRLATFGVCSAHNNEIHINQCQCIVYTQP